MPGCPRPGCGRRHLGTEADRATFRTLHTAVARHARPCAPGSPTASAEKSVRHLRSLLGAPAIALTDTDGAARLGRPVRTTTPTRPAALARPGRRRRRHRGAQPRRHPLRRPGLRRCGRWSSRR